MSRPGSGAAARARTWCRLVDTAPREGVPLCAQDFVFAQDFASHLLPRVLVDGGSATGLTERHKSCRTWPQHAVWTWGTAQW
ncbi:hypothetical protein [Streptomyces sp. NPDC046759]|uniref:hypothetical protein n=1 Tax=Streptomyces sp. NPDC046759 TaxID=3155019 RepID=UPI0033CBD540